MLKPGSRDEFYKECKLLWVVYLIIVIGLGAVIISSFGWVCIAEYKARHRTNGKGYVLLQSRVFVRSNECVGRQRQDEGIP